MKAELISYLSYVTIIGVAIYCSSHWLPIAIFSGMIIDATVKLSEFALNDVFGE